MEHVRFKLKSFQKEITPTKQKETLISLYFSYGYYKYLKNDEKKYIPLIYSTGLKIKPYQWNFKKCRVNNKYYDYKNFNDKLDDIETDVKKLYRTNENITPEQLKKLLQIKRHPEKINFSKTQTLNKFIEKFINDIKTGEKKTPKGTNYKQGTIETYNSFNKSFQLFQKKVRKIYDFNDITMDFYKSYTSYLSKNDFSPNTIGKHIKTLKTIMNDAKELKLHSNTEYTNKAFKTINNKVENIYLSETEIKKLYYLDLPRQHLELARDVFLVGCYTAQRFSDYSIINKSNIKKYNNRKYIELTQKKTNEKVIIPIRTELNNILKKYDYNLPKTYEQKVNKYIKEIGKLAEINSLTDIETNKGGLQIKKQVPKYELITTHTARRSGATNMYLAGVPELDIMKITGHKSESSFLRYIKATKQETAEKLSLHPYFNSMVAN